jgi:hypothetical protein
MVSMSLSFQSEIAQPDATDKNAVVLKVSLKHTEPGQVAEKQAIGKIRFPSDLLSLLVEPGSL